MSQSIASTSGRQITVQVHAFSRRSALAGLVALPLLVQTQDCHAEEANVPLKNYISKTLPLEAPALHLVPAICQTCKMLLTRYSKQLSTAVFFRWSFRCPILIV